VDDLKASQPRSNSTWDLPAYIALDFLLSAISTAVLTLPISVQIGALKD
jgi:hypothetical protein